MIPCLLLSSAILRATCHEPNDSDGIAKFLDLGEKPLLRVWEVAPKVAWAGSGVVDETGLHKVSKVAAKQTAHD